MNRKVALLAVLLGVVVLASGCVTETQDTGDDGQGTTDQALEQSQEEIVNDLGSDIINESETIEIGEII